MMGLYNVMFGENNYADAILYTLGLTKAQVGRFRDVWVEQDQIVVYTRNGGGNREHWDWSFDTLEGPDCNCPGCIIEYRLPQHPLYRRDEDDEFDCTYARVFFTIPSEYATELKAIAVAEPIDPSERWLKMIEALKG